MVVVVKFKLLGFYVVDIRFCRFFVALVFEVAGRKQLLTSLRRQGSLDLPRQRVIFFNRQISGSFICVGVASPVIQKFVEVGLLGHHLDILLPVIAMVVRLQRMHIDRILFLLLFHLLLRIF